MARNGKPLPAGQDGALKGMNCREQLLLRSLAGDSEPRICVRSRTRIDTGRWWRRSPLWLCVVGDQLVALAVARRRYTASIALSDCRASRYCNASGELLVEPAETLEYKRFRMSPRQALHILAEIDMKNENLKLNTEY